MPLIIVAVAVVVYGVYRWLHRRDPAGDLAGLVGPVGWTTPTDWSVVRPLARADLRRVLLHPAFVAGVALTPFMLILASTEFDTWRNTSTGTALALVPLGWLTIIATNLVTLRPRRTGASELFAALPAPQPVRTTALLATMIGPVVAASLFAAGWLTIFSVDRALGGSPEPLETMAGVLIVAGAVSVGIAVAQWLPHPGFGIAAVVVVTLLQARFLDVRTWPWNRGEGDPMRFLAFLADPTHVGDEFLEVRQPGWHVLYLVGLVALMAGVALARDGLGRVVAAVLAVSVLGVGGSGWMQTRPLTAAQEAEMVSFLTEPALHQVCDDSTAVRYCAYPNSESDIAGWRARVEATLAVLPSGISATQPPLEVIQRPQTVAGSSACSPMDFERTLPPVVAAMVSKAEMWPADAAVHPGFGDGSFPCSDREVYGFFLAVQIGAWGVGLPPAPHHDDQRCVATGQARSAMALWAGAAASQDGTRTLRDVAAQGADPDGLITFPEWDGPPMWGVDYSVADAGTALAMLELPVEDVRATLELDWNRWTDPTTSTGSLAATLGLDATDTHVGNAHSPCR